MTLDELKERLKEAGITPICVTNDPPDGDGRLLIDGGLKEYLETARAIGATTLVVYARTFDEEYFLRDIGDRETETEEDDEKVAETIDLCTINRTLSKYKEYVGQHAMFRLSIHMRSDYLDLVIEEHWWRAFLEERSRTTDELDNDRDQKVAAERAQEEAAVDGLIARLHKLVDDVKFAKLPTQRAMLQYALRVIPELESLDAAYLKSEIQEVKAKIDADT